MARFPILLLACASFAALSACKETSTSASPKTVELYQTYCSSCHEVGAANAPRRGDAHQWGRRLKKSEQQLVSSIRTGLVAMPPMGGCKECTDDDFKALIAYMAEE